ncbi:uncharacterized [Tachysurus ichikawai]
MDQNLSGLARCGGTLIMKWLPLWRERETERMIDLLLSEQLQRTAAIFCVLWKAASVAANQMRRFWGAKARLGEGQAEEEPGFCCNYYTF